MHRVPKGSLIVGWYHTKPTSELRMYTIEYIIISIFSPKISNRADLKLQRGRSRRTYSPQFAEAPKILRGKIWGNEKKIRVSEKLLGWRKGGMGY